MDGIAKCRQQVAEALERLMAKGLLQPPDAEFSVRIPGQAAMVFERASRSLSRGHPFTPLGAGPARVPFRERKTPATTGETPVIDAQDEISVVAFDAATGLPPSNEASPVRLHAVVYRHRPDVGAILTASLPWASRLASLGGRMPAVFDEQARYLGARVEPLALEGMKMTQAHTAILKRGGNAFLFQQGVICLGCTAARATFNAELLEKCAQAFILASLTGHPTTVIPSFVRYVAVRRLRRDQKRASEAFENGWELGPNPFQ
jgi:ribulose-5-phosphate 4-epimerase/fuculose-1-phosphate aldolase